MSPYFVVWLVPALGVWGHMTGIYSRIKSIRHVGQGCQWVKGQGRTGPLCAACPGIVCEIHWAMGRDAVQFPGLGWTRGTTWLCLVCLCLSSVSSLMSSVSPLHCHFVPPSLISNTVPPQSHFIWSCLCLPHIKIANFDHDRISRKYFFNQAF